MLPHTIARSELLQDGIDARDADGLELGLETSVSDLAVVNDGSKAAVAACVSLSGPANLLCQVRLQIAGEDCELVVLISGAEVDLLPT